jgi:PKHD-type hydroxylase
MLNNYFHIFEKAVPSEFCDYVIKSTDWKSSQNGKIRIDGNVLDKKYRNSENVWVDKNTPIGCVLQTYVQLANSIWNYSLSRIENVQMTKYPIGGHYDFHIDSFEPVNGEQRKLSIVMLLNDEFTGGGLEISGKTKETVLKSKGDIVVFPSFLSHRVIPVESGTRYTAVSWAYGPTFR